jgi:hypothetical protein
MTEAKKELEEKMELTHEPIPFYKKVFHIVITIGVLYLILIFLFAK